MQNKAENYVSKLKNLVSKSHINNNQKDDERQKRIEGLNNQINNAVVVREQNAINDGQKQQQIEQQIKRFNYLQQLREQRKQTKLKQQNQLQHTSTQEIWQTLGQQCDSQIEKPRIDQKWNRFITPSIDSSPQIKYCYNQDNLRQSKVNIETKQQLYKKQDYIANEMQNSKQNPIKQNKETPQQKQLQEFDQQLKQQLKFNKQQQMLNSQQKSQTPDRKIKQKTSPHVSNKQQVIQSPLPIKDIQNKLDYQDHIQNNNQNNNLQNTSKQNLQQTDLKQSEQITEDLKSSQQKFEEQNHAQQSRLLELKNLYQTKLDQDSKKYLFSNNQVQKEIIKEKPSEYINFPNQQQNYLDSQLNHSNNYNQYALQNSYLSSQSAVKQSNTLNSAQQIIEYYGQKQNQYSLLQKSQVKIQKQINDQTMKKLKLK